MPLTNAQKQARYRDRLKERAQTNSDTVERELMLEAERTGELSEQERIALAEKLADLAKDLLWRAHRLSKMAHKLRTGEDHPLQR
jgi:hypothetical protein